MPEPARRSGRESAPLGRHGGASRLVRVAIDEMAPLTRIVNVPMIEYEFSFNGQKYTGRRIGIGEDAGGSNIEATLARYPRTLPTRTALRSAALGVGSVASTRLVTPLWVGSRSSRL
jgi:hypothetical protein